MVYQRGDEIDVNEVGEVQYSHKGIRKKASVGVLEKEFEINVEEFLQDRTVAFDQHLLADVLLPFSELSIYFFPHFCFLMRLLRLNTMFHLQGPTFCLLRTSLSIFSFFLSLLLVQLFSQLFLLELEDFLIFLEVPRVDIGEIDEGNKVDWKNLFWFCFDEFPHSSYDDGLDVESGDIGGLQEGTDDFLCFRLNNEVEEKSIEELDVIEIPKGVIASHNTLEDTLAELQKHLTILPEVLLFQLAPQFLQHLQIPLILIHQIALKTQHFVLFLRHSHLTPLLHPLQIHRLQRCHLHKHFRHCPQSIRHHLHVIRLAVHEQRFNMLEICFGIHHDASMNLPNGHQLTSSRKGQKGSLIHEMVSLLLLFHLLCLLDLLRLLLTRFAFASHQSTRIIIANMNNPLLRSNPKKVQSSVLKPPPIISPLDRNPPLISPQISPHTPSVPPILPICPSMGPSSMTISPATIHPSTSLVSTHLPPSQTNFVSVYRQSIAPSKSSSPNVTRAMSTRSDDMYSIDIKFERSNSSYRPQELVCGTISLIARKEQGFSIDVQRIIISVGGRLALQNKANKAEYVEMVQHHQPIEFISLPDVLVAQDKTLTAESRIPFRFKLEKKDHRYLETYIGMYINISYTVVVTVLFKDQSTLVEEVPFYVQVPLAGRETIENLVYPKKKSFLVRSQDVSSDKPIGQFKIRGELQSQICYMSEDLSGWLMVDIAESPLRSIDLQLLRVERVQLEGKVLHEKSQIQLIQICDGNVSHSLELPLYMILPRYFCCPSVKYLNYQVNFQINLLIGFRDGFKVTANIPLKILRS